MVMLDLVMSAVIMIKLDKGESLVLKHMRRSRKHQQSASETGSVEQAIETGSVSPSTKPGPIWQKTGNKTCNKKVCSLFSSRLLSAHEG
jgi:hypothetical protein